MTSLEVFPRCFFSCGRVETCGELRHACSAMETSSHLLLLLRLFRHHQADGPVAVEALLNRVFSLATHPDKNRRLGGLMAFNQLCRPLREETALVSRYCNDISPTLRVLLFRAVTTTVINQIMRVSEADSFTGVALVLLLGTRCACCTWP